MAEEGKFRVEKWPKLPIIEDENGGLSVPEGSIPIVGWKNKTTNDYEGQRM